MGAKLPRGEVSLDDYRQDLEQSAAYARVTGFSVKDAVPATWLHVCTFGLQGRILRSKEFPFSLAGLVHVSNEMVLHRPVGVAERLRLAVTAENLQPHKKGATFELRGRIHVGDELVWEGSSNYLSTKADVPGDPPETKRLPMPEAQAGGASQRWRLPADLGRQYARVSGDWNPIHLHPLTARIFGFPRPIIHGMWTHARALAAFGGQLPDAYRVRVQFTKPILLPGRVGFVVDGDSFAVVDKEGKPKLVGELTEVPAAS
ncbi:MAG: hypothetical protein GX596_05200 [Propionibacterium sp.]|nr:hypothetical protein [Propionibacterium sp.]